MSGTGGAVRLACALVLALGGGGALAASTAARVLSYAALASGTGYDAPVDYAEFAPPPGARPPSQQLNGRLQLTRRGRNGLRMLVLDRSFLAAGHRDAGNLPEFDFEFLQSGADLIPVRRGAIAGRHPTWEFILEPGRVWDADEDAGYSRASLPFTLEERNENCMHNGALTFLFKSDGRITHAAWQIASETCRYEQFDAWGWLAARYTPRAVSGAAQIAAAFHREVAARLPVKPLAQLAVDYPGAVSAEFGAVREVSPESMTVYGLLVDGVHYTGGCQTRHGQYPYCEVLDLPSYSLAKSLVGGLALMRLERLYPGAAQRPLRDYVPACARGSGWAGVSFANALDMATGLYRSSDFQADENDAATGRFFFPLDHEHKIGFACTEYPRQSEPGTLWVYHSSDSYLLGTAINGFLRQHGAQGADYFHDLLEPIWRLLDLSPPVMVARRSYDQSAQPFTGFGLTLHRDDIVKLARFLSADAGRVRGQAMLDPAMLAAALQRVPDQRGLPAGSAEFRYQHGFWAYNVARVLGCRAETWVPFMSGFGGLAIVMLPNDTVYYYVSDGNEFHWAAAAAESNRIRRYCTP